MRSGWRGAPSSERRSTAHGSSRRIGIAWYVPDDRQPLGTGDPGEEGDEGPGPRVGAVQVLDDEQDRPPLPEPPDDAEDALEQAGLATFGHRGQASIPVLAARPGATASSGRSGAARRSPAR